MEGAGGDISSPSVPPGPAPLDRERASVSEGERPGRANRKVPRGLQATASLTLSQVGRCPGGREAAP